MKKIISMILVIALVLSLSLGCFSATACAPVTLLSDTEPTGASAAPSTAESVIPTEAPTSGATEPPTEAPTQAPTEAPTQEPTDAPTEPTETPTEAPTEESTEPTTEPAPTDPSTPTQTPTTPPVTPGKPVVTKHPTSENVREGGYAEFVARANYCSAIIWHLQNAGGSIDLLAENVQSRFPGLVVTGLGTERLGLNYIPKELDGWRVRAEFVGRDGNTWSDVAIINVTNQELSAPTIYRHPSNANLKPTEVTTLKVSAISSDQDTVLSYQWYRSTTNSNSGGKAILGANAASFTPDYIAGTTYYYCAVRSSNGSEISAATNTNCAAVTYEATADPDSTTPTQIVPATQAPTAGTLISWEDATAATEQTLPQVADASTSTRSNTLLIVIIAVIVVIVLLGAVATILILKFYPTDDDEPQQRPVKQPASRPNSPTAPTTAPKFASKNQPREDAMPDDLFDEQNDQWDDLSDLGDLSIYFDDDEI